LASQQVTLSGGSVFEVLEEIAAYAMLAINMGLDVWGIMAGVSLLLVPTPLSIIAGLALIAASVAALGFDIVDLMDLVSGDKSASQYIGEQINGFIVGAILKRFGIAAAARVINRLGPGARDTVFRQLDGLTDGMASRFTRRCGTDATTPDQQSYCDLFTDQQYLAFAQRVPPPRRREVHEGLHFVASEYSATIARRFVFDSKFDSHELVNALAAIRNAPPAEGLVDVVRQASKADNAGSVYQVVRARRNLDDDPEILAVLGYERPLSMADVEYQRLLGFDANGQPRFGDPPPGDRLSGDVIYSRADAGDLWTETKDTSMLTSSLRTLNQLLKGQAAVEQGKIPAFRVEVSGAVHERVLEFARQYAPRVEIRANLGESLKQP
jgi:hypothetical protein